MGGHRWCSSSAAAEFMQALRSRLCVLLACAAGVYWHVTERPPLVGTGVRWRLRRSSIVDPRAFSDRGMRVMQWRSTRG
jgi:ABC-type transport system involved in cytochrome c biogenesis permease subunit